MVGREKKGVKDIPLQNQVPAFKEKLKEKFIMNQLEEDQIKNSVKDYDQIIEEKEGRKAWFGDEKTGRGGVLEGAEQVREIGARVGEWNTAMMESLKYFLRLAKAQAIDPLNPFDFLPYRDKIDETITGVGFLIRKAIASVTTRDKDLPIVDSKLEMDNEGHLNITLKENGVRIEPSKNPLEPGAKELYEKSVKAWLKDFTGCSMVTGTTPDQDVYMDSEGKILNNEALHKLMIDESNGFAAYVKHAFDYQNLAEPEVGSSPRPF